MNKFNKTHLDESLRYLVMFCKRSDLFYSADSLRESIRTLILYIDILIEFGEVWLGKKAQERMDDILDYEESKLEDVWVIEYSEHSFKRGLYPFHINTVEGCVRKNLADMMYEENGANKWQVIHIGTSAECHNKLFEYQKLRPWIWQSAWNNGELITIQEVDNEVKNVV